MKQPTNFTKSWQTVYDAPFSIFATQRANPKLLKLSQVFSMWYHLAWHYNSWSCVENCSIFPFSEEFCRDGDSRSSDIWDEDDCWQQADCRLRVECGIVAGNDSVPKIIINNTINLFLTAISILLISNHNSFRVLFDKIASVYFTWKIYLFLASKMA